MANTRSAPPQGLGSSRGGKGSEGGREDATKASEKKEVVEQPKKRAEASKEKIAELRKKQAEAKKQPAEKKPATRPLRPRGRSKAGASAVERIRGIQRRRRKPKGRKKRVPRVTLRRWRWTRRRKLRRPLVLMMAEPKCRPCQLGNDPLKARPAPSILPLILNLLSKLLSPQKILYRALSTEMVRPLARQSLVSLKTNCFFGVLLF